MKPSERVEELYNTEVVRRKLGPDNLGMCHECRCRWDALMKFLDEQAETKESKLEKTLSKAVEKLNVECLAETTITKKVPFDENPECGGLINLASNIDSKADMNTQLIQAFEYGFRTGWKTCWEEHNL